MPRSLHYAFLVLSALALIAPAGSPDAKAQTPQRKHFGVQGTVELGGSTAFTASQPVVAGVTGTWVYEFSLLPYVGYFVIDGLELGVNPAGLNVISDGDTKAVQIRVLFAPSYNFHTATIATPFVEGLAGITSSSLTHGGSTATLSGFTFGGRAGIKTALVERGLLTIGVQFLRITLNAAGAASRSGANELSVSAGWTVWL